MSPLDDHADTTVAATASIGTLRIVAMVLLVVVVLLAIGAALAMGWQKEVSLESLIRHRAEIEALVLESPLAALASYIAIYTVASGLALPGVVFLTIGGGAFFGGLVGGFMAVTGASLGATAVFLVAKYVVRRPLMRWIGPQAARFAEGFRNGAFNYLLFIRLVPIFPFTLGNVLPALCGIRLRIFVAATYLGIIPMTLAFAFFGAGLDSALAAPLDRYRACMAAGGQDCRLDFHIWNAVTPQFLLGVVALGIAALLPALVKRWRQRREGA
ncbi:MAG TPA: VTT domain-containing protein [Pseudolabrys sp.]|jgi:uncharacterized membrane protein YdjX (TVP38/TMEM64 family)|nr:VTT domain-containing protein [Pseudolabrys sp.]